MITKVKQLRVWRRYSYILLKQLFTADRYDKMEQGNINVDDHIIHYTDRQTDKKYMFKLVDYTDDLSKQTGIYQLYKKT